MDETEDRPCNDCGAPVGTPHGEGCDVAVCVHTGMQRIQCGLGIPQFTGHVLTGWLDHDPHPGRDCGQDTWTGQWPGEADAIRLGWWCYFVPGGDPAWVQCSPDHPEARPDLNRLAVDGKWNPELRRWEAREMTGTETVPDRAGQIVWLTEWAARYGVMLQLRGEVGFGRECTGIVKDSHYIDTADIKQTTAYAADGGPWWEPEDSYHKHDCLAVLGYGDGPLRQLYDWVKWLDQQGYGVEEVTRKPTSNLDLLFHGATLAKIVKL